MRIVSTNLWSRETLPHAVTNRYPIPYRITDAERFVHRFAGEKGNKKAPALRVQGRSFFDRLGYALLPE